MRTIEAPLPDQNWRRAERLARGVAAVVLISAALAVASRGLALQNEPDGFGKAKFGMSATAVREAFPEMRALAAGPESPIQIYTVENQSFGGLRPCKVTFSFLADKLYEAKFDCGRAATVKAALYETFGAPSVEEEKMAIWRGERAVVTMNRDVLTFAFANLGLTAELTQYILQKALTAPPPPGGGPAQEGNKEKEERSTP